MSNPAETTPTDEAPEPPKPDALAILRQATVCTPLTHDEILGAVDTQDFAPFHIAAILVAHCADRADAVAAWRHLRLAGVKEKAGKYLGRQVMPYLRNKNKPEQDAGDTDEANATQTAADYYNSLFGQVTDLANDYNQDYRPDGKPNAELIGDLFDATDGTPGQPPHPAVAAAEDAFSNAGRNRDMLGRANQLVRYMVLTALQQEPNSL